MKGCITIDEKHYREADIVSRVQGQPLDGAVVVNNTLYNTKDVVNGVRAIEDEVCNVGDRFIYERGCVRGEYIVASLGAWKYCLIDIDTGIRFSEIYDAKEPVSVLLTKLIGRSYKEHESFLKKVEK
jgi:hypothetical protein